MVQLAHRADLLDEARQGPRGGDALGAQTLDRDRPPDVAVLGELHYPHAPLAQHALRRIARLLAGYDDRTPVTLLDARQGRAPCLCVSELRSGRDRRCVERDRVLRRRKRRRFMRIVGSVGQHQSARITARVGSVGQRRIPLLARTHAFSVSNLRRGHPGFDILTSYAQPGEPHRLRWATDAPLPAPPRPTHARLAADGAWLRFGGSGAEPGETARAVSRR